MAPALLRSDRFRGVVGLSVPFVPRRPARPTSMMPQTEGALFYQLYFQAPGVAESELERDVRRSIRSIVYSLSGDAPRCEPSLAGTEAGMVPRQGGMLSRLIGRAELPGWLNEADVDFYVSELRARDFAAV